MTEAIRAQIEQYLAGAMPPAEAEAFLLRLRADPVALAYLGRVLRQDALLFHLQRGERQPLPEPKLHSGWLADVKDSARRILLAASVILVVGVGTWFAWRSVSKTPVAATVAEVRGDVFLDHGPQRPRQRATSGQHLEPGARLATSGPESGLVLSLADGSRLEAFAETAVQLGPRNAAETRVVLEAGELEVAAVIQPPGHALVLETGQAETKVLGTRFRLARAGEATRLEVMEGKVEFRRKSDGATIQVTQQQQAVVRPDLALAVRPLRVGSGLLALYRFDGPEEWVRDRSGASPPADLKAGKAGWRTGGLAVPLPLKFDAGILPGRVRDRINQTQEYTLEFWVAWEPAEPPQLHHMVVTRSAAGEVGMYQDGAALATEGAPRDLAGPANYFVQELRKRQIEARAKDVTLGLAAIYGRALSAAEVRQNHQAGAD